MSAVSGTLMLMPLTVLWGAELIDATLDDLGLRTEAARGPMSIAAGRRPR
jgi:hypothetical protein